MRTHFLIGAAILVVIPCWAADEPFDIKPGLWDFSITTQINGLPQMPNLDKMSPEQRARFEAAMKNVGGTHSHTSKTCVTRERIDEAIGRASSSKNNTCAPKLVSASPSKVVMHIECTQQNGEMKSNGDMTLERRDREHFTGAGSMKSAGANGRAMDVKWSMTGAFASADCGSLKSSDK